MSKALEALSSVELQIVAGGEMQEPEIRSGPGEGRGPVEIDLEPGPIN